MAIVAVAAGDGWTKVYKSLGVSVVVPGGQTMNPSTQDLLHAVEACSAPKVFLLPNNGNIIMSARQVADLTAETGARHTHGFPATRNRRFAGIQSRRRDFDANGEAMESASKRVQTAEITRAVRTVQIDGINVTEGDVIGLINNRLVTSGTDLETVVLDTLQADDAGNYEIITVYYGADISSGSGRLWRSTSRSYSRHKKSRSWRVGSHSMPISFRRSNDDNTLCKGWVDRDSTSPG